MLLLLLLLLGPPSSQQWPIQIAQGGEAKGVWDAVDTSPDLGGQNVLKTSEMESRRVFCRWIYFHLRSKIFFWSSYGGGQSPPSFLTRMDPPLAASDVTKVLVVRGQKQ